MDKGALSIRHSRKISWKICKTILGTLGLCISKITAKQVIKNQDSSKFPSPTSFHNQTLDPGIELGSC